MMCDNSISFLHGRRVRATLQLYRFLVLALFFSACASGPEIQTPPGPAHVLLAGIVVDDFRSREVDASYNRKEWRHWIDEDGDCQKTRDEVLIRDGSSVTLDPLGCKVRTGVWNDPYTGVTFVNKSDIDIDHLVPLKDAHVSGGYRWDAEKKKKYANYLVRNYHLLAVEDDANQAKRDKSPDEWMPPNTAFHCTYLEYWVLVKSEWELSMTREEHRFIDAGLKACE